MLSHSEMQTLKATRETTIRLWNDVLITSEEKQMAMNYLANHFQNLPKIYAINKRMSNLILTRDRLANRPAQ